MNIILIYFALKYKGDWNAIYHALDVREKVSQTEVFELEKRIEKEGWKIITILDYDYPKKLKECYKPPFVLWFKGNKDLLKEGFLALTGNQTSEKINKWIADYVPEAIKNNFLVTCSYKGADEKIIEAANHKPILYIGASGLDKCLVKRFKENDLLITEYPNDEEISKQTLQARNRIVASLAQSLVLFSSEKNGGINNLITNFLNLGKEIYCFPGDCSESDGNAELIKQGANFITSIKDMTI